MLTIMIKKRRTPQRVLRLIRSVTTEKLALFSLLKKTPLRYTDLLNKSNICKFISKKYSNVK